MVRVQNPTNSTHLPVALTANSRRLSSRALRTNPYMYAHTFPYTP